MIKNHEIKGRGGEQSPGAAAARKFWNMASISEDDGEITLYGDIMSRRTIEEPVDGNTAYITPEGFLEELAAIKGKSRITVKLNSAGGDLYTGIAIHNALKGLKGTKTVVVEGLAASAASVIMCAGDVVQVWPGSIVMIHGVSVGLCGYYTSEGLKQIVKGNEAAEKAIAAIYGVKTGTAVEILRAMMDKETWMDGATAIAKGFADVLLEGDGPSAHLNADGKTLVMAGVQHDLSGFEHIPQLVAGGQAQAPAGSNSRPIAQASPTSKPAGTPPAAIPAKTDTQRAAEIADLYNRSKGRQLAQGVDTPLTAKAQKIKELNERFNAAKTPEELYMISIAAAYNGIKLDALKTDDEREIEQLAAMMKGRRATGSAR